MCFRVHLDVPESQMVCILVRSFTASGRRGHCIIILAWDLHTTLLTFPSQVNTGDCTDNGLGLKRLKDMT